MKKMINVTIPEIRYMVNTYILSIPQHLKDFVPPDVEMTAPEAHVNVLTMFNHVLKGDRCKRQLKLLLSKTNRKDCFEEIEELDEVDMRLFFRMIE